MRALRHAVSVVSTFAFLAIAGAAFGQGVTFAPAVTLSTGAGSSPFAIGARDLDGDGKLDLAVPLAFVSPGQVMLFPGAGSGSPGSATTLATGASGSAVAVAFGDFDANGAPDLAIANSGGHSVSILLGAGAGSFGLPTVYPTGPVGTGQVPFAVAVGDFNRDGKADLAVANQFSDTVAVLLGNGNGTFGTAAPFAAGDAPVAIAVADFNGDAMPDIVTANAFSSNVSVMLGNGTGGFSPATNISTGSGTPNAVAVADLNGDGKADVIVGRGGLASGLTVLLGNGNGTFGAPASYALGSGDFVKGVAVADFDGDGKLDVAAGGGASFVWVFRGLGAGSLASPLSYNVGVAPNAIVAGDFDDDAIPDLATADQNAGTVSILRNTTPWIVSALAWGDNRDGALGNGTTGTISSSPVGVQNLTGIVDVAAGAQHSVAVKADGTAWSWGAGFNGGLGNGTTFNPSPVPVQVTGLATAVRVAAGVQHALALMADGTVWAWGLNSLGQLGNGTTDDSHFPVQSSLSGVVAVAAGGGHSLALKADGTVWAFGRNDFGQLGDGTFVNRSTPVQVSGLAGVVAIAAAVSDWHSLAVKSDGTVWAWGRNHAGQLGDGTLIDRATPVQVPGLAAMKRVAAGTGHSVALKADGTVWTWGANLHGQLGDGTVLDRLTALQVSGIGGVISVTAGMTHTVVLKADGTVWSWGANSFSGQLGDGTLVGRLSPVQVTGVSAASALATGGQHSIVILGGATIAGLAAMVQNMAIAPGVAGALSATLDAAQRALDSGHAKAACGSLGAFERQVRAHRGRALPAPDADRLIAATARVAAGLGCS